MCVNNGTMSLHPYPGRVRFIPPNWNSETDPFPVTFHRATTPHTIRNNLMLNHTLSDTNFWKSFLDQFFLRGSLRMSIMPTFILSYRPTVYSEPILLQAHLSGVCPTSGLILLRFDHVLYGPNLVIPFYYANGYLYSAWSDRIVEQLFEDKLGNMTGTSIAIEESYQIPAEHIETIRAKEVHYYGSCPALFVVSGLDAVYSSANTKMALYIDAVTMDRLQDSLSMMPKPLIDLVFEHTKPPYKRNYDINNEYYYKHLFMVTEHSLTRSY